MKTIQKAILSGILFVMTLAVNTLGGLGLFNGLSQKDISDRFPTQITPSSSTFGIWGLIYTLLIVSVLLLILKSDDAYYSDATNKISKLFAISNLLNMGWIVAFSFVQIELSSIFIIGFVITLALICLELLKIVCCCKIKWFSVKSPKSLKANYV